MELLRELKMTRKHPIEVIMITGEGTIPTALEAVRLGAYDYLMKPFIDIEPVIASVRRAADRKQLIARNASSSSWCRARSRTPTSSARARRCATSSG